MLFYYLPIVGEKSDDVLSLMPSRQRTSQKSTLLSTKWTVDKRRSLELWSSCSWSKQLTKTTFPCRVNSRKSAGYPLYIWFSHTPGLPRWSFFAEFVDLLLLALESRLFQSIVASRMPMPQGPALLPVWSSGNPADHLLYLCLIFTPFRYFKQAKLFLQLVDWERFSRHIRKRNGITSLTCIRWAWDFCNCFGFVYLDTLLDLPSSYFTSLTWFRWTWDFRNCFGFVYLDALLDLPSYCIRCLLLLHSLIRLKFSFVDGYRWIGMHWLKTIDRNSVRDRR